MSAATTSERTGATEEQSLAVHADGSLRTTRRGVALAASISALTLLSIAWRIWLVRHTAFLTVRVDEDGYLVMARALAGGPGGETTENPLFRHVGYPLLITPVYWFTHDPASVYKGVQIFNAIVNSLTLPLAYLAARRVFAMPRVLSVVVATVAASIPAVAFYGEFALTDSVLAPLFAAWILTLHATLTARSARAQARLAAVCGAFVGLLWLVHVRSIVIVLVHVVAFAYLGLFRRVPRRVVVNSFWGIVASIVIDVATKLAVGNAIVLTGNSPAGTLWTRLFTPFGLIHTVNWAIGQVWYLSISTLGLAAVGGVVLVAWLRRREAGTAGRTAFLACLAAVTLGIAFFSAATLPDDGRINLYAYARYIAFTAPLWILVAVAGLAAGVGSAERPLLRRVPNLRLIVAAAIVILASAYVVVSYSNGTPANAVFLPFDAPEAAVMTATWDRLRISVVTALALIALVGLVVALTRARMRLAGLGVLLVLSIAAMPAITAHAAQPMSREFSPAVSLRDAGVTATDVVAMDKELLWWEKANVQWEVSWAQVAQFDSTSTEPPADATVVIAPYHAANKRPTWDGVSHGWRMVVSDSKAGAAIWRRA